MTGRTNLPQRQHCGITKTKCHTNYAEMKLHLSEFDTLCKKAFTFKYN